MFPRLFLEVGGCSGRKSMNTILRGQSTHCCYIVRSEGISQMWISWPRDIRLFDFVQPSVHNSVRKECPAYQSWAGTLMSVWNPRLNKWWSKTVPAIERSSLGRSLREGLRRVIANRKAPPFETCRYRDARDNLSCVISLLELHLSYT